MPRPLSERIKDWKWWGEQVAHTLLGFTIAWAMIWIGVNPAVAVGWSAFMGGVREIDQNHGDTDGSLGDSVADLFFWVLGAVLAGV